MTMTRPCLRMTLHLLQIFFTLGLTFIDGYLLRRSGPFARSVHRLLVTYTGRRSAHD